MERKMYFHWVRHKARKGTKIEEGKWSKKSRLDKKKSFSTVVIDYIIGDNADIVEIINDLLNTINKKEYCFVKRFDSHFRNGGNMSGDDFELLIIDKCKEFYQFGKTNIVLAEGDVTVNMCIHNRQKNGYEMIHKILCMEDQSDTPF